MSGADRRPASRAVPRRLWSAAMSAARARFGQDTSGAIVAFGIGPDIRKGVRRRAHTLNVYVRTKVADPAAPIDVLSFRAGDTRVSVVCNVVATGKLARATANGAPAYTGVHAGAPISVRGAMPGNGAIAALLASGGPPTHALTAGHLFLPGAIGEAVYAAAGAGAPRRVGTLVANFLDARGLDAALLELTADGRALVTSAGPRLRDYVDASAVWGLESRAFLATANDFSRQTTTGTAPLDTLMSAPTRGAFWVRDGIATDGEITNPGDSGTVLSAGASNEHALGICSGALGAHSIFVSFDRALALVQASVDPTLTLA